MKEDGQKEDGQASEWPEKFTGDRYFFGKKMGFSCDPHRKHPSRFLLRGDSAKNLPYIAPMLDPRFRQTWERFLPRKTIVMARRRLVASAPVNSPTPAPESAQQPTQQPPPQPVNLGSLEETETVKPKTLEQISADLGDCSRCKLCHSRKKIVFGEGNPRADLVFIGEGPGEQEDLQGRPFVGMAGQLLDRMIQAMGTRRENVYIANVVKCRPPGNRTPEADEIEACSSFLERQLDVLRPKVIVALGKLAAQTLLQTDQRISMLRGRFHTYRGAKLMPTFHPAYLLRNPDSKREVWADLQQVAKELGLEIPRRTKGE